MIRRLSNELSSYIGERVHLRGWLHNCRILGKLGFVILRDRAGYSQIVLRAPATLQALSRLQPGSVLAAVGQVRANAQSQYGVELIDSEITIEVSVEETPPLEYWLDQLNVHLDTLLDDRAIALRNRRIAAVFRIQGEIAANFSTFMRRLDAVEYFGPSIIGNAAEGGADSFQVTYFEHSARLAQSNQLYKQIMVGVFERVFAILPFFRAENSNTTRHLAEGRQLEFEMGFFEDWTQLMDIHEEWIKFLLEDLRQSCRESLHLLDTPMLVAPKEIAFPRLTFKEAQEIAFARTGTDERAEEDLSPKAEKALCTYAKETFGTDFLFVTHWSATKRPFYSFLNEEDPRLTNTFDLLGGGSEISSGGQRRHLYTSVLEGLRAKGLQEQEFTDYLNAFRFGLPPHGGMGIGLERLTMNLLQLKNIRQACPFPSDPRRIAGRHLHSSQAL